MFEPNYCICLDCVVLVPRLVPLLVLNKKMKQDLKKEKIGDSKRRARSLDTSLVFGAKSGSGWEGWEGKPSILCRQNARFWKSGKQDTWQQGSGNDELYRFAAEVAEALGKGKGKW